MSYDLKPNNRELDNFHLGAFSWGLLLESFGCLWPFLSHGGQWYCVFGADKRMVGKQEGPDFYPLIMSNDGFQVTAEEARIMARCARNFVLIQRSLPDEHADKSLMGQTCITRDNLLDAMAKTMQGRPANENWPVKIRSDFVDKYEKFAEWAEKSGGFQIW